MNRRTILSREDYADFLIRLVFGDDQDLLMASSKRAYLDVCRTLRGLSKVPNHEQLVTQASRHLRQRLLDVASGYVVLEDQDHFDAWHRTTCERIAETFAAGGFATFQVGQAQKWVNLTFKYVYTMGATRLPGFEALYPWCHVPLDSAIMEQLLPYGFPPFEVSWNRVADYAAYLERQNWIRQHFVFSPLDIEFYLSLGKDPVLPE